MAQLRKIFTAVFLVIALHSLAHAGPYGDCKQQSLNKFGFGVLTMDFGRMIESIEEQGGCGKLLKPEDPNYEEIIEFHKFLQEKRRDPLERSLAF